MQATSWRGHVARRGHLSQRGHLSRVRTAALAVLATVALSGCLSVFNAPLNVPATAAVEAGLVAGAVEAPPIGDADATVIGLAFSGGGTRAAAYSYGVLRELEDLRLPHGGSLLDHVRFVAGTSGGSVTAAYFGLRGRSGYQDLYQRFLTRDAEAFMRTSVTPVSLARAFAGGVNNRSTFGRWLDENLFNGATFADLQRDGAPLTWINATDLSTGTPFVFNDQTFAALCSDLQRLPISEAVSASSAVPVVFSPITIQSFGANCPYAFPVWLSGRIADPDQSAELLAFRNAIQAYRTPGRVIYVNLVDGGLTNNFGITGFTVARAEAQTAYGPLSAEQAVRLRRAIFLIADAGAPQDFAFAQKPEAPNLPALVVAMTDTAIETTVRAGYDAFRLTMTAWREQLIRYRCGLSDAAVRRLRGSLSGWNCRALDLTVARIAIDSLDAATIAAMDQVPTRLTLPLAQVDLSIAAGRQAFRANADIARALRELGVR